MRSPNLTEEQKDKILALWPGGMLSKHIALALGVNASPVRKTVVMAREVGDRRAVHHRRQSQAAGLSWTDERVERLKALWADESLTAAAIGREMGFENQAACLSKAKRLGLPRKPRRGWKLKKAHDASVTVLPRPKRVRPKPVRGTDEPVSLNLTLLELADDTCKWAVNDGRPFLFCGHAVQPGASYCKHHFARTIATKEDYRAEPGKWIAWSRAA